MQQQLTLDFEPALLQEIEEKATYTSVAAQTVLINVGEFIRTVPIVLSGIIRVVRTDEAGRELLLYYITEQESCAMTFNCCMERVKSEIKAITEEETHLWLIPIDLMETWMMKYPSWKNFIMRTIRLRFHELLTTIDHIAFNRLDERLVFYLKERATVTGSTLLNLSHEQIAKELATSRVVISRLLKKLEEDKKLLLYRNQIKLLREM